MGTPKTHYKDIDGITLCGKPTTSNTKTIDIHLITRKATCKTCLKRLPVY